MVTWPWMRIETMCRSMTFFKQTASEAQSSLSAFMCIALCKSCNLLKKTKHAATRPSLSPRPHQPAPSGASQTDGTCMLPNAASLLKLTHSDSTVSRIEFSWKVAKITAKDLSGIFTAWCLLPQNLSPTIVGMWSYWRDWHYWSCTSLVGNVHVLISRGEIHWWCSFHGRNRPS